MSHFFYLTPEILLPFKFESIRHRARALWQDETRWSDSSATTNSGSYKEKQLDESTSNRLARRAGPQKMPLMKSSVYSPYHAGSQEAADGKGWYMVSSSKHSPFQFSPAHQIWGTEAQSPAPLNYKKPCVRPKKPSFEILMGYKSRGKKLLKQFQRQWDYESKFGSSEDSEADRYS
uniref:RIKEN cDNA 1700011L22 gene n=1 Tax=Nannospalax galili TaxID=1026970 RepID=A0A8C6RTP0_NANGA